MATFGPFPIIRAHLASDARFAAALRYVSELLQPGSAAHRRIQEVVAGETQRIELEGGTYVLQQVYQTKLRAETYFESHRRNIDLQVVVEGSEAIEIEDISRLTVDVPYDAERELIKYADTPVASRLAMRTGDAAVFYPVDGHMPTLRLTSQSVLVRKSVVKIPIGTP